MVPGNSGRKLILVIAWPGIAPIKSSHNLPRPFWISGGRSDRAPVCPFFARVLRKSNAFSRAVSQKMRAERLCGWRLELVLDCEPACTGHSRSEAIRPAGPAARFVMRTTERDAGRWATSHWLQFARSNGSAMRRCFPRASSSRRASSTWRTTRSDAEGTGSARGVRCAGCGIADFDPLKSERHLRQALPAVPSEPCRVTRHGPEDAVLKTRL
jgi:hypothetical protein